MRYEVIVGNIGSVYDGTDPAEARRTANHYAELALSDTGRAAGELVTILVEGEPAWDNAIDLRRRLVS